MPENGSVNFSGNEFSITFDEFFKLKEPGKEIFISPPMRIFPEIRIRQKTLHLEFTEPLRANTTYTVNFRQSDHRYYGR